MKVECQTHALNNKGQLDAVYEIIYLIIQNFNNRTLDDAIKSKLPRGEGENFRSYKIIHTKSS